MCFNFFFLQGKVDDFFGLSEMNFNLDRVINFEFSDFYYSCFFFKKI